MTVPTAQTATGTRLVKECDCPVPHILTEWQDSEGRDYVRIVNNTPRTNAYMTIRFCGNATQVHRVDWLGVEVPHKIRQWEDKVSLWLHTAPGQMEIFRLEPAGKGVI